MKGLEVGGRSAETRFKPGHVSPHKLMPIGSYRQTKDGYWMLKVRDDAPPGGGRRNWELVHRLTYIAAHGPIPDGHVVVLLDGDPENCLDPGNVTAIERGVLGRLNQIGWKAARNREERLALIAVVQLHNAAHAKARGLGIGVHQRRRVIGRIEYNNVASSDERELAAL